MSFSPQDAEAISVESNNFYSVLKKIWIAAADCFLYFLSLMILFLY
jgi:hypothetical protein